MTKEELIKEICKYPMYMTLTHDELMRLNKSEVEKNYHYVLNKCTIEERVMAFGRLLKSNGETEESYASAMAGYKVGATKQRAIDIDKACEWLEKQYPTHYMEYKELAEQVILEFRKAMED